MTPVRGPRGRLSHVTEDVRRTLCGKPCDAWIVLDFRPEDQPDQVTCQWCRDAVEFN